MINQILTQPEVWACLAVIGAIIATMTIAGRVLILKATQGVK